MVPDARLLRYFLAVAEEENFTRAAERLHIAQPALSAQIRQLEERLGVRLLHRSTRVVRLTEAGRAVVERGPAVLSALEEVWESARRAGRGELGRLRLVYSPSSGYGTTPQLVEFMRTRYPDVEINARLVSTPDVVSAVHLGHADVGIARSPVPVEGVRLRTLRLERHGALVSKGHPLATAEHADVATVAEFPLLLHSRAANPVHYDEVISLFDGLETRPHIVDRSVEFDPTRHLLRDNRTVAMIGESALADLPEWLCWIPLDNDAPRLAVQLVLPVTTSPVADLFERTATAFAEQAGWLSDQA
jgi:DNA-binding transcriptional LysR family regulator